MGDFRQVLPVLPRANRGQIVRASFKHSPLWRHFTTLKLTTNMHATCRPPSPGARTEMLM